MKKEVKKVVKVKKVKVIDEDAVLVETTPTKVSFEDSLEAKRLAEEAYLIKTRNPRA